MQEFNIVKSLPGLGNNVCIFPPYRAGSKFNFNPISPVLSIHLILLALHSKIFL